MLLEGKNAVIYGGGGSIGGGVARAFARESARIFLPGRTGESLEMVAADVTATLAGILATVANYRTRWEPHPGDRSMRRGEQ